MLFDYERKMQRSAYSNDLARLLSLRHLWQLEGQQGLWKIVEKIVE